MRITKGVIPAAGLGIHFLPISKAIPKEMLPLVDTPTIQLAVEEAVSSGITDILIITGRGKRAIEDHFDRSIELEEVLQRRGDDKNLSRIIKISELANIHYIRQKEAKGLGHAILCAKSFVNNEPFAVLLGDDFYVSDIPHTKQIIEVYNKMSSSIISVIRVLQKDTFRYGIIDGQKINDQLVLIKNMIEKPNAEEAPSNLAISGRYILTPDIFEFLEKTQPGKGGEIQLTDALQEMQKTKATYAYLFEGERFDIGSKLGFYRAFIEYGLQHPEIKDAARAYLVDLAKRL